MIYGERIRLNAVQPSNLPLFVEWLNDPEVNQGLMIYLPMSLAYEEKWFEKMLERPQDEQPLTIEVKKGDVWEPIGNLGLFDFEYKARRVELGIMIGNKKYWNQGYGTEAIQLMLKHCFQTLNMNRVMLQVYQNNPRAIRCYEKCGFQHEGALRQALYQDGKYYDILNMGILKEEWILLDK